MANERKGVEVYVAVDNATYWSLGHVLLVDLPEVPTIVGHLLHDSDHEDAEVTGYLHIEGTSDPIYVVDVITDSEDNGNVSFPNFGAAR